MKIKMETIRVFLPKYCLLLSLLLVSVFSLSFQASASVEPATEIINLFKVKAYKKLLPLVQKNVETIKKQFGEYHIKYANSLRLLAKVYVALNRLDEAQNFLDLANSIGKKSVKPPEQIKDSLPEIPGIKRGDNEKVTSYFIQKIFYATDRNKTSSDRWDVAYGGKRALNAQIRYGSCEVSIPANHKTGILERPNLLKMEWNEDPNKHIVLLTIKPEDKGHYFASIRKNISHSQGKNAFVFVHGYNVSFEEAARRTAQMAHDLNFDGAPVFYSWPSEGRLDKYSSDEENSEWTQSHLQNFLSDFVTKTNAENIYLIAHSMGTKSLTRAVKGLIAEDSSLKKKFREIILAAPDIDADLFKREIAPKMVEAAKNVTLYVSSDDIALLVSNIMHGHSRAGEAGSDMVIIKGIDTIDVTGMDASFLAHTYIAIKSVLGDLASLILGKRPGDRKSLKKLMTNRGAYWSFSQ